MRPSTSKPERDWDWFDVIVWVLTLAALAACLVMAVVSL